MSQPVRKVLSVGAIARKLGFGSNPTEERTFLLEALPRGSVGAEIGVHEGGFSRKILRVVDPAVLHLIDPWKHESAVEYSQSWYGGKVRGGQDEMDARYRRVLVSFAQEVESGRVIVHRGDSGVVSASFPDDYFDWVYIDGNHLYEFVKRDLEGFYAKTKSGGLIAGDDYQDGGWWGGGVKTAVDEFVGTHGVELVVIRDHQFILRKTG